MSRYARSFRGSPQWIFFGKVVIRSLRGTHNAAGEESTRLSHTYPWVSLCSLTDHLVEPRDVFGVSAGGFWIVSAPVIHSEYRK